MTHKKKTRHIKPDKRLEKRPEKKTNYDKIKELEQELSNTKYNKRTEHAIGLTKAKIANLKKNLGVCFLAIHYLLFSCSFSIFSA